MPGNKPNAVDRVVNRATDTPQSRRRWMRSKRDKKNM